MAKIKDELKQALEYAERIVENTKKMQVLFANYLELDFYSLNFYSGCAYVTVKDREELQRAMSISPGTWAKYTSGDSIVYSKTINEVSVTIYASDKALPDTCKLVEEDVIIPAQPARVEKRSVIKCTIPQAEVETVSVPETQPATSDGMQN